VFEKKRRETSKVLLWTIVTASLAISVVSMVLCAWLAVDQLGIAITVIGGLWSGAVIAAIGFYSDKAKAENEIKLQAMVQAPSEELLQAREQLAAALGDNKKLKTERDAAKKEALQLKQRLSPLEEIIRQSTKGDTP